MTKTPNWFSSNVGFPSKGTEDAIRATLLEPDAKMPATKGALNAGLVLIGAFAAEIEKRVTEISENLERRLVALHAKADKITDLERRFKTFDPLVYDNRECGKRSVTMRLSDGRDVLVTTEVSSANGETLVERASRVDKLEGAARELESQLHVMQQQLSLAHKRIAALERAKERQ